MSTKKVGFLGGYSGGAPMAVGGLAALVALGGFMVNWYRRRDRLAIAAATTGGGEAGSPPSGAMDMAKPADGTTPAATEAATGADRHPGRRRGLLEGKPWPAAGRPDQEKPDDGGGYVVI